MSEAKPNANGGTLKEGMLRLILTSGGGGAGVAVVYFAYELLQQQPQVFGEMLLRWGPGFIFMLGFMWIGHGYVKQQSKFAERQLAVSAQAAAATGQQAEAQRGLTSAVQQIVEKDDRRAQATEAAIGFVAQQNERILSTLVEIKERLPQP